MTDVLTGWTFTRSIRNNAEKHIISALDAAVGCVPFPVLGMDFDNGSEFINHSVVRWPGTWTSTSPAHAPTGRTTRPPSSRRTTTWCAATPSTTATTPARSARSWAVSGSRSTSSSTSCPRKPIGWDTDKAGRHKRLYDAPRTPLDRLLDTSALTKTQKTDLVSYRNQLNPASITRRIIDLQNVLIHLAKDKTDQRLPRPDPKHPADIHKGVRVRKAS